MSLIQEKRKNNKDNISALNEKNIVEKGTTSERKKVINSLAEI